MVTEARKRANRKYDEQNTRSYHLKMNIRTDKEIIERLAQQESIQGYIKRLVLEDIKKEKP